MYSKSHYE